MEFNVRVVRITKKSKLNPNWRGHRFLSPQNKLVNGKVDMTFMTDVYGSSSLLITCAAFVKDKIGRKTVAYEVHGAIY